MNILSKMLRIAGRGPDGLAKAIQTDVDGNLQARIMSRLGIKYPSPVNVTRVTNTIARPFAQTGEAEGFRYGIDSTGIIRRAFDASGETGFESRIFLAPEGYYCFGSAWAYRFENGRLLIVCRKIDNTGAGIFVSDLAEDTAKVFTLVQVTSGEPYSYWGWDVWGDMVFMSEYQGVPEKTTNGRYIYMSRDQGLTWSVILDRTLIGFQGLETDTMHFHDVGFDPWTGMVWVTCGDYSWANVLYTYDFGVNWHELYEGGTNFQFLGVSATPEYVIFGTDFAPNGIYVIKKPTILTRQAGEFVPSMLEQRYRDEGLTMRGLFHSFRYVSGVWFAVSTNTTKSINPVVLASPDGYTWYELYRHNRLLTRQNGGFLTFYRVGNSLFGRMYDDDGVHSKLLRIPIPVWNTLS